AGTGRSTWKTAPDRGLAKRLLAESELQELCRLRLDGCLSASICTPAGKRRRKALRNHVLGGGMVAMSPPDHHGLSDFQRRAGGAPVGARQERNRQANACGGAAPRRCGDLSGAVVRQKRAFRASPLQ